MQGQQVKVEYEGTVHGGYDGRCIAVKDDEGHYHYYYGSMKNHVTPVDPEFWPPQVGDLWKVGDDEWYAKWAGTACPVHMVSSTGQIYVDLDAFRKLNPALIRRKTGMIS